MIDLTLRELPDPCRSQLTRPVQTDKGGNPEVVKESQKKRGASVELVDEVIALISEWKSSEYRGRTSQPAKLYGAAIGCQRQRVDD